MNAFRRKHFNVGRIVPHLIVVVALLGCHGEAKPTYPGGTGSALCRVEPNEFDSSFSATGLISEIETWSIDDPQVIVQQPQVVITDRYVNNTFYATYVSATADFEINKDATTGPHDFTLSGIDANGTVRMKVSSEVYVYRNRTASFLTWWILLTGGGAMLLVVSTVVIGTQVSEFRQRQERLNFTDIVVGVGIGLVALVGGAACLWFGIRGLLEALPAS